jgi:hypothetical protein
VTTKLCLHRGSVRVGQDQLAEYPAPPPTDTWFPVSHARVLTTAVARLNEAGYQVRSTDLGVSPDGHRFFGTVDLESRLAPDVGLAVGLRNSTDKSFPLGFCAGSRVFVCDNLAFRSELLVRRTHTKYGEEAFANAISRAVASLGQFATDENARIVRLQESELTDDRAHALILRAYLRELVSYRLVKDVVRQWEEPEFDWGGKTLWRLTNAFTRVMTPTLARNPNEYATRTIRLNNLLDPGPVVGVAA